MSNSYTRLFELSLDMLCVAGIDGYFKELNPAWERTLGYKKEELLAKPYLDFVHPDDREATIAEAQRNSSGAHTFSFENRYRCKDGSYKWLMWQATPMPEENLIYAIARDITVRKQMEEELRKNRDQLEIRVEERTMELYKSNQELRREIEQRKRAEEEKSALQAQLIQAQKMDAIGRLAGGVAHDFNNLLTAIGGYSHFLLGSLPPGDPNRADVEEIKKAGDRASSLTRQLLAFSRQQVLEPRVMNCNSVVRDMHRMLERLIGEDVQLQSNLNEQLWDVKADPGQMEQVLLNLVVNSRDAMPGGGKIEIETNNVELGEDYARMHLEVKPGPHVMLAVSDTGHGMDSKVLARLFEPFFTTKEKGKGTGLGLATVYGIVKQSGGSIFVYSEPGKGTSFKIYLPKALKAAEPVIAAPVATKPASGSETILLVEDDELVRKFAHRVLAQNGYNVLVAPDPDLALKLCRENRDRIHLMLTDVVMPKMRGSELAKQATALCPQMKVIFMSGYTERAVIDHDALSPAMTFIQKPMTADVLLRKIRGVLDSPATR